MEKIFEKLNESQTLAVKKTEGPVLILAGAGSGKTTTIISRLAYLIKEVGIPPANTLTLTFTNKAAKEMKERSLAMIEGGAYPPLLCTFHKFGLLQPFCKTVGFDYFRVAINANTSVAKPAMICKYSANFLRKDRGTMIVSPRSTAASIPVSTELSRR